MARLVPAARAASIDAEVTSVCGSLNASGMWPDVDYSDSGRSWWGASEHLRRVLLMASAHAAPRSSHAGNHGVLNSTLRAFEWWLLGDKAGAPDHSGPTQNSNWWWMQIGVPRIVAKVVLLVQPSIAEPGLGKLLALATPLLSRTPLYACSHNATSGTSGCRACVEACDYMNNGAWTGCNRVWAASVHVLRGAIERNATRTGLAFEMAHSAIQVVAPTAEGGIQTDGSFHQHGPQLYTGWGYGGIFSTNVLVLDAYVPPARAPRRRWRWSLLHHTCSPPCTRADTRTDMQKGGRSQCVAP